jgi:hypothetical protein
MLEADASLQQTEASVRPVSDYPNFQGPCFVHTTHGVPDWFCETGYCARLLIADSASDPTRLSQLLPVVQWRLSGR